MPDTDWRSRQPPDEQVWLAAQPPAIRELVHDATIFYPDYNPAIIGVLDTSRGAAGVVPIIVYNMYKVVDILQEQGMTRGDAEEFVEFNTIGGWLGPYTPLHVWVWSAEMWRDQQDDPTKKMPDGLIGIGHRCGQDTVAVFDNSAPGMIVRINDENIHPCWVIRSQPV